MTTTRDDKGMAAGRICWVELVGPQKKDHWWEPDAFGAFGKFMKFRSHLRILFNGDTTTVVTPGDIGPFATPEQEVCIRRKGSREH